jgi:uncharacterized membrane protein YbaN (DUF454 family)
MSKRSRKTILVIAGTISACLGILGIFLPVLPTTPFLLIAAACYLRSSARLYRWLLNNHVFGLYIKNYLEGKGMLLYMKLFTISLLWISIGLTAWLTTENLGLRIFLACVAVGVTLHIILIKTLKKNVPPSTSSKNTDNVSLEKP